MNKLKHVYEDEVLQRCYEMGYDSAFNGANVQNCNFTLFSSPDRTKAWEKGNKRGLKDCGDSN